MERKSTSKQPTRVLLEVFGDDYIEFSGEVFSHLAITFNAYSGEHPANPLLCTCCGQFSRAYDDVVALILEIIGHSETPRYLTGCILQSASQIREFLLQFNTLDRVTGESTLE